MPDVKGEAVSPDETDIIRPRLGSLADLFFSFTILALQDFGGVFAVVQRELVERKRWLSNEEFIEDCTIGRSCCKQPPVTML
jgi:chromate transporter